MTTVAPPNMVKAVGEFYAADHSSLLNDGIVGDTSHLAKAKTSGTYHISAQDCGNQFGHLYSLQRPEDIAGGKADPTFASAHDIGGNQADRITVTKRVLAAFYAKDPRLVGVAEFAGTTNGTSVHACYPNTWTDDPHNNGGWDAGHYENHCHVSFKRDHCNNYASVKAFMDIVAGVPAGSSPDSSNATQEEDMALSPDVQAEFDKLQARITALFGVDENGDHKTDVTGTVQAAVLYGIRNSGEIHAIGTRLTAIEAKLGITS